MSKKYSKKPSFFISSEFELILQYLLTIRIDYLQFTTSSWPSNTVLTYSFKLPNEDLLENFSQGWEINKFDKLSSEAQHIVHYALKWWQAAVPIQFKEDIDNPDLYILASESDEPFLGYTKLLTPGSNLININEKEIKRYIGDPFLLQSTIFHELGHLLGLGHPFESALFTSAEKETTYSVMNNAYTEIAGKPVLSLTATPMDIDCVQFLYGKNLYSNPENTVYQLRDYLAPSPQNNTLTIASLPYDSGGKNTLSASNLMGATLDIRPYGISSTAEGWVYTPNMAMHNIISGTGETFVYLNDLDNIVDITKSAKTHLITRPDGGTDVVYGFKPGDTLIFQHAAKTLKPSYSITTQAIPCLNNDEVCTQTTIQFSPTDSVILKNVSSIKEVEDCIQFSIEDEKKDFSIGPFTTLEQLQSSIASHLSYLPVQLAQDFIQAFLAGAVRTFISELTDHVLLDYGCNMFQRKVARILLNTSYVIYNLYQCQLNPENILVPILLINLNLIDSTYMSQIYAQVMTLTPEITLNMALRQTAATTGSLLASSLTFWGVKKAKEFFSLSRERVISPSIAPEV